MVLKHSKMPSNKNRVRERGGDPLWRKCIIVLGNAVAFACFGFNYGLWPLIDRLKTFFEDYSSHQEQDLDILIYINLGVTGISAMIAGLLSLKFGTRKILFIGSVFSTTGLILSSISKSVSFIYFTYGGLTGIGFGLTLSSSLHSLLACFDSQLGVLFSIALCGIAVAVSTLPLFISHVVHTYSLFSVFLILAALNAHQAVFAALFHPPKQNGQESETFNLNDCCQGLLCGQKRLVVLVANACIGAAFNSLIINLSRLCKDEKTDLVNCNEVMITCGVSMFCGLLLIAFTWLCKPKNQHIYTLSMLLISTILSAIAGILSLLPRSVMAFYLISVGIGFSSGMCLPMLFVLTNLSRAANEPVKGVFTGTALMLFGVGALLGLFLGDFLTNVTGYQNSAFILSAICMLIVTTLMLHWLLTDRSTSGDVTSSQEPAHIVEMDPVPVSQSVEPGTSPALPGLASVLGRQNNVHINEFHVHFHGSPGNYNPGRPDMRFDRHEALQNADRSETDVRFKRFLSVPLELEY